MPEGAPVITAVLHSRHFKHGAIEIELKGGAPRFLQVKNSLIGRPGNRRFDVTEFLVFGDLMNYYGNRIHYSERIPEERTALEKKAKRSIVDRSPGEAIRLILGDQHEADARIARWLRKSDTSRIEQITVVGLEMKNTDHQRRLILGLTDKMAHRVLAFRKGDIFNRRKPEPVAGRE